MNLYAKIIDGRVLAILMVQDGMPKPETMERFKRVSLNDLKRLLCPDVRHFLLRHALRMPSGGSKILRPIY